MSDSRTLYRSFAGGEITPELFGRVDLVKFQTGLALCKNFRVLPHGPIVNREGSEWVIETKDSTKQSRVIPFVLSDAVNYILEFGDQYIRFHTNGGTVVETAKNITAVTQANPGVVTSNAHGYSNGQWVYIDGVLGMTQVNGRFFKVSAAAANTFALQDVGGTNIDTTTFSAYVSGGTASRVYEIASPYLEADLFNLHYAQATTKLPVVHTSYAPRELVITTPTSWALNTISFDTPVTAPTLTSVSVDGPAAGANPITYSYAITAVDADGNESQLSNNGGVPNDLWTTGHRNAVVWSYASVFDHFNVYRATGSAIFGFIGSSLAASSFLDQNVTADYSRCPPLNQTIFASASNYPAAVCYFEQRRVFAGTTNDPQTTWLTRTGSDANMAKSYPTIADDDPIKFRAAALKANQIKHAVPLDDLFLFTASVVWRVFSENADALTPDNITVRPLAYNGSTMVQPVVTGSAVLFEEKSGHVVELRYNLDRAGYAAGDASIMAPQLFDGYSLRDLTFAAGRTKTCWAVRSDGTLLGMTYIPDQEVIAWHQHTTDGTFESCAAVQEGTEDALYVIVKRTVNGRQVRYIERVKTRTPTVLADVFYVDAGKTYSGAATSTITNLHHLEGKTVNILADGAVHAQRVVTGGAITLDSAASKVTVGLPITAQAKLLPLAVLSAEGAGLGVPKNVAQVTLRVTDSSSIYAGSSFDKLRQFKQRTTEPYGSPPALFTGVAPIKIDGTWSQDAQVCIQQTDPLPLKVTAIALEVTDAR